MALATSVTSARVGRRAVTIEASIWVAVIAGFELLPARRISRFCSIGVRSSGISIPRSPRATMIPPLANLTISSAFSAASCFSILATRGMREPASRRGGGAGRGAGGPGGARLQVGSGGDEGDGEEVDAFLHREFDPAEVDPGGR